mmetsp:Transcript_24829/g.47561  ORF Transcript_24829/g.47561 Transcript_24829/m.47561 type:complete len:251 (+) Transcript_24829:1899-2651(+)
MKSEECSHARHLFLRDVVLNRRLDGVPPKGFSGAPTSLLRVGGGNAQCRQENRAGLHPLHFGAHPSIELLAQRVILIPRECMEEIVFTDPEQIGELFVVCSHDFGLGGRYVDARELTASFGNLENIINVLDGAETLRVEAKSRRSLELGKARLKVEFYGIGGPSFPSSDLIILSPILKSRHIRPTILGQIPQMHPHHIAQPTKLHTPLVFGAKPQRRHSRAVIKPLQLGVALQNVQHRAIYLPQELERGK